MFSEQEHTLLKLEEYPEKARECISKLSKDGQGKPEVLGLHYSQFGGVRPGGFVGAVWIGEDDNRIVLKVDSKFPKMDYMKMFIECCEHPIIGERISKCFECWPEQELIKLPDTDDFSIMVIIAYLRELNTLCVRHLRRHFERRQENFIGKVKGKILIGENIRRNVVRARPDRIFCEYQAISDDILENRILRAALERAARYISQDKIAKDYECLHRWVHACRAHLQGVSVTHISHQMFSATRNRGMFTLYRRPLNLAKAILCRFGFNPHEEVKESTDDKSVQTPPYAINSAELFERYAELKLMKRYADIIALYDDKNIRNKKEEGFFNVWVRPDFYVPRRDGQSPKIIDAKYKNLSKFKGNFPRQDLYQVISYSSHRGLLEKINKNIDDKEKADDIELSLVYPNESPKEQEGEVSIFQSTKAFLSPITIYKIRCPMKDDSESPSQ